MTQKEKNLYNLYNSLTPYTKKEREAIIENPKKMEEKENLIKIDKVRQKLSNEKKKKLNDIEEILNRPKRRVKYGSLLNLQPEITDKNRTELFNLKNRKQTLTDKENTFKYCFEIYNKTHNYLCVEIELF